MSYSDLILDSSVKILDNTFSLIINLKTGSVAARIEFPNIDREFVKSLSEQYEYLLPNDEVLEATGSFAYRGDFHTEIHYIQKDYPYTHNYVTIPNHNADIIAKLITEFMDKNNFDKVNEVADVDVEVGEVKSSTSE